jgi:hypothetical protein
MDIKICMSIILIIFVKRIFIMRNYKYNIKARLSSMLEGRLILIEQIIKETGCSKLTFYRWWNIQIGSQESIPSDDLKKISKILGVTMDDLYNEKILEPCRNQD